MRICVFSGTTEGHELSRFLAANGVPAEVFVATEYGAAVMEPMPGITVHEGRLDENEIAARLDADTLLIDATHPYAALVTDNLRTACAKTGARYERLLRPALRHGEGETVPDTEAAVAWLSRHPGKVLLTTGSKELEAYTAVENFAERLYPRVLPSVGVIQKCASLGFPGSHIIAMQGPFSAGMNAALIRQTGAEILVTKDTGATGGFAEKLAAARETGIKTLIIARPREESGRSLPTRRARSCGGKKADGAAALSAVRAARGKAVRGVRRRENRGAACCCAAALRRVRHGHSAGKTRGNRDKSVPRLREKRSFGGFSGSRGDR